MKEKTFEELFALTYELKEEKKKLDSKLYWLKSDYCSKFKNINFSMSEIEDFEIEGFIIEKDDYQIDTEVGIHIGKMFPIYLYFNDLYVSECNNFYLYMDFEKKVMTIYHFEGIQTKKMWIKRKITELQNEIKKLEKSIGE